MPNEKAPRTTDTQDTRRMRVIAIGVLLLLVSVGVATNLYTGQERFGSIFLVALLTAICGLLGFSRIRFT